MEQDNTQITAQMTEIQYDQAMSFLGRIVEYVDNVDAILRDVASHYDADRAYVFEFSEDGTTLDNTYEWCKQGVEPQIDALQNIPYESVTVWVEEFERVGAFYISCLDKDVESSSLTYEILEPQGIESLLTAPIYKDGKIIGFIGVDNPQKNIRDLVILKTTASILYSEISRKIAKKNQKLKEMVKVQNKQVAQLGEIRDIIASANMGIWRIELIDGEEPHMFVDETMKKLLGIEGQERTPEKTYMDWFENITPDALASVLSSVERMEQGFFDENTYLWKHPTKGIRYVRCGGTSKPVVGGYSLQGYHYDVDEVVRKEQAQMLKLQKALEDKREYYRTLGSLSDIFYSMHVIDLVEDTVVEYNAKGAVKDIVCRNDGAVEMMRQIMDYAVTDEYREEALEFSELTTLADRMRGKMFCSQELVGKNVGWFLASFIVMEKDKTGRPTKVIYTTRIIDEEKRQKEKLIHKTQTDEMTGLLNRRAYEEKIYEHNDLPVEDKFIYVSLDANGLKVVNDTLGHAAGDELLVGTAQCMKKSLGHHGNVYRIGGDEFVAILFCDEEEAKAVLREFDETVANWKGKLVDEISVSYGWVNKYEMPEASTRQLGAVAEKRMYEAKSEHYRKKGVDRKGQQDAHKVLCALYAKILRINITDDTYQIINMDESEQTDDQRKTEKISEWLHSFGRAGYVHPEDLEEYLRLTDLQYLRDYFAGNKTSLHVFYRRKYGDSFKPVMMELVLANDYSEDNQSLFLYVKSIEKE